MASFYPIHFELSFDDDSDPAVVAEVVVALVEALAVANLHYLRGTPSVPALYRSGVVYQREVDREEFLDVARVMARGAADCEDLAAWRIAELRWAGVDAVPLVTWEERGKHVEYHVQLQTPEGIEDPSVLLGMP